MNDMANYLTTKNRLQVAMLAFILPFSFAKAEVKEDGKTISQGWYVGLSVNPGPAQVQFRLLQRVTVFLQRDVTLFIPLAALDA